MVSAVFFNSIKNLEMKKKHVKVNSVCFTLARFTSAPQEEGPELFRAAEPAAQHSGARGMDRRQGYDSKTIKTPHSPVFSKPSQIQVSSQVKTARHGDSTLTHGQEIYALSKGCPLQGYRGQSVTFIIKETG